MEMVMLLCVEIGEAMSVQWCPKGGNDWCPPGNKLGILAGVFTDGTVSLFAIPEPDIVREAEQVPENEILAGGSCWASPSRRGVLMLTPSQ